MKIEKTEFSEEQGPILEDDIYPATLTGFGEFSGQYGDRLVWQFELKDENGEKVEAAAFTSYSMADKPRKSNLLKFSEALVGGDPEGVDLDDLVGKPCRVSVTSYTKESGITKQKVVDVLKPGKGKGKAAEKSPAGGGPSSLGTAESKGDVEFNEKDFDDIPFAHVNTRSRIAAEIL